MVERLAQVLEKLVKEGELKTTLDVLESKNSSGTDASLSASHTDPRAITTSHQNFKSISELVEHYHKKQKEQRAGTSSGKGKGTGKSSNSKELTKSKEPPTQLFSLNFAKYNRAGRFSYKMVPPGLVQIPGFSNDDTYKQVIIKGAKGLEITNSSENLLLLVSNGLVKDTPLPSGKAWTLGNYISEFGGIQARGKRTFGIFVPVDTEDVFSDMEESDVDEEEKEQPLRSNGDDNTKHVGQKRVARDAHFSVKGHLPKQKRSSRASSTDFAGSYHSNCRDTATSIPGSVRSNPITFDSSEKQQIEINFDEELSYGIYWPTAEGRVITTIQAKGREGVWRIMSHKYYGTWESTARDEKEGVINLQPELNGFFLAEVHSEGTIYLKAQLTNKENLFCNDVQFVLKEKKIVHSKQLLTLQGNKPLPLLVISPNHGKVNYRWEQRFSDLDEWKIFDVPLWTCLLYVECARQYRCTVEDKCVVFHVKDSAERSEEKSTHDAMLVDIKEVHFGDVVGHGAYGTVHKGTWQGKTVALKRISIPPGVDKTQMIASNREIAALKLLEHPNLVSLLGYTTTIDQMVLIMNFINGKNLHVILFGKEVPYKIQKLVVAKGIANGVEYMHTRKPVVIHRDLKPLNIMVTHDSHAMICDMGIAKLKEVTHTTVTTASKAAMGTYPYMAPEMFGSGHRNTAVDIYSLGCLYIELFGGKRVWQGISDGMQIMQKVCGSFHSAPEMPATSHLDTPYKGICEACCQLEPSRRATIQQVVALLEHC